MKYQNLTAFEKHLEQAAKVQLSRVFLVVSSCPYERKKIAEKIISTIHEKESGIQLHSEEATQGPIEEKIANLNTASLWEGKQILYLDGIDKLKKNGLALLAEYVTNPSPFAYLILGANSSKGLSDIYAKGKKEMISCDLSEEKPWDRKDRLKRLLVEFASKEDKRLLPDAIEHLIENVGLNLPGLEQEVDKLITYVGKRREITLQDVHVLCFAVKTLTIWQLSEAIVWSDVLPKIEESLDLSGLLPLLSQLRNQLQHGMSLSILLEKRVPIEEISRYFPTLKPAALNKMIPICKRRQPLFFKRALDILFDLELLTKNSSFDPALILELFLSKITRLKRHYALPVSQSSR